MLNPEAHIARLLRPYSQSRLLVACSGGVDSMVLLDMIRRQNYTVEAAHVNYGLRGKDSDLDEQLVRDYCTQYALPCHIRLMDPTAWKGNIQEDARNFRYRWLEELAGQKEGSKVLFAHHADDQVETFFLNLARKSGVMGLACMPFERSLYLRPLLEISRETLVHYALENNVPWREDTSNAGFSYRRNILRNKLIPEMREMLPDLNDSVLTLVHLFQENQRQLETRLQPLSAQWMQSGVLMLTVWNALQTTEKIELLRQLEQPASLMEPLDRLASGENGKWLELHASANFPYVRVIRENAQFRLVVPATEGRTPRLISTHITTLPETFDKHSIYLDADRIIGKLHVRPWRPGDRMNPVGMEGSKLISDIILEARVPFELKSLVQVVHDDKHIHWCVGHKIGRYALATPRSERIVKCTISYPESPE